MKRLEKSRSDSLVPTEGVTPPFQSPHESSPFLLGGLSRAVFDRADVVEKGGPELGIPGGEV